MTRPVTYHVFRGEDIDFSLATAIQIPALCGRWFAPNVRHGSSDSSSAPRVCGSCRRVVHARGQTFEIPRALTPQEAP